MLKIPKKKRNLFLLIQIGGVVGMILCACLSAAAGVVFCAILWIAGVFLKDSLYRCPHCGHYLKERNHRGFPSDHLFDHCPGCGWRVQIEIE